MKYLDYNGLLYVIKQIKAWLKGKVDKVEGKGLSTNDFTNDQKTKLEGLENYTLPTASADTKGGFKVGAGLTMNGEVLSATGGGTSIGGNGFNVTDTGMQGYGSSVCCAKGVEYEWEAYA